MAVIWATGLEVSGSAKLALACRYARVQVTAIPAGYSATADLDPRYRNIGIISPMVGDYEFTPQLVEFQEQVFGPFSDNANGFYYSFSPGVVATIELGYEMADVFQPSSLVEQSVVQPIADSAIVMVTWGLQANGIGQLWDIAAPTKWTIKEPGLYIVAAQIQIDEVAYTAVQLSLYVNGVRVRRIVKEARAAIAIAGVVIAGDVILPLAIGDYVELQLYQASGASRNTVLPSRAQIVRIASI